MTPEISSPNALLGFFEVMGFRLGFASFSVHAGAKTYLGVEVGTRVCLGRVAQVAGASFVKAPLRVSIGLQRGTGTGLRGIAIDGHAAKDGLC